MKIIYQSALLLAFSLMVCRSVQATEEQVPIHLALYKSDGKGSLKPENSIFYREKQGPIITAETIIINVNKDFAFKDLENWILTTLGLNNVTLPENKKKITIFHNTQELTPEVYKRKVTDEGYIALDIELSELLTWNGYRKAQSIKVDTTMPNIMWDIAKPKENKSLSTNECLLLAGGVVLGMGFLVWFAQGKRKEDKGAYGKTKSMYAHKRLRNNVYRKDGRRLIRGAYQKRKDRS